MRVSIISRIFGILFTAILFSNPSVAGEYFKIKPMHKSPEPGFYQRVPGEIIVKFKSGVTDDEIAEINGNFGTKIKKQKHNQGKFKVLKANNKSLDDVLAKYKKHPKVEYALENTICYAQDVPNDTYYDLQWNFYNTRHGGINIEFAWDITKGSKNVVVAVLDTGIAKQATDFTGTSFAAGYDFINDDNDPTDDEGHGTHVAGTIAQATDNGRGVAGIAPVTTLMPVKVLDANGSGTAVTLAHGIEYAADNGADIINMSLSWPSCYNPGTLVLEAIQYATGKGVTLVAAAGNDNRSCVNYPAAYPEVIAVGATDYRERRAYYSSYGDALDIAAPGGDVRRDSNRDGYVDGILQQTFGSDGAFSYYFYQGTSMASPHVAGVAALLIANDPTLVDNPGEVRERLEQSAEDKGDPGWDPVYGHGLLDAFEALNYAGTQLNNPPIADVGGPYDPGIVGTPFNFTGSGSDPDGDSLEYYWDFGEGDGLVRQDRGPTPNNTYETAKDYLVTLVVNDGQLDSSEDTVLITITADKDPPPVTQNLSVGIQPLPLDWIRNNRAAKATVVVTVTDGSVPVEGVAIQAEWTGAYSSSVSLVTDGSGQATSETRYINKPKLPFIFTVTDLPGNTCSTGCNDQVEIN